LFDKTTVSSTVSKKFDKKEKPKKTYNNINDSSDLAKPSFFNNNKIENNFNSENTNVQYSSYQNNKFKDSYKSNKNTNEKSKDSGPINFIGKVETDKSNFGFKDYTTEHQVKYHDKSNNDKDNKKQYNKNVSNFNNSSNKENDLIDMPVFINNEKIDNNKEIVIDVRVI